MGRVAENVGHIDGRFVTMYGVDYWTLWDSRFASYVMKDGRPIRFATEDEAKRHVLQGKISR